MRFWIFYLLSLFWLSSCGFQPIHAKKAAQDTSVLPAMTVEVIGQKRLAQQLRIALEDRINPGNQSSIAAPKFRLITSILETEQAIIIEQDASITRFNLILQTEFRVENAAGEVLMKDTGQRVSSYNVSQSDFANFVARRDAREKGIEQLAETMKRQIASQLAAESL
jgi:LPS-assembly lipoprotein